MVNLYCKQCGKLVLEMDGQSEKLDSLYLPPMDPLRESVGYWHTSCLASSDVGSGWHDVKLRNHVSVRGYQQIGNTNEWSIVRHPRASEVLAFSRRGQVLSLTALQGISKRLDGGTVRNARNNECHLHLADQEVAIQAIQEALLAKKEFPIPLLFEMLELSDRLSHPEALDGGVIRFGRSLRRDWDGSYVAGIWDYGVFVPNELEAYLAKK